MESGPVTKKENQPSSEAYAKLFRLISQAEESDIVNLNKGGVFKTTEETPEYFIQKPYLPVDAIKEALKDLKEKYNELPDDWKHHADGLITRVGLYLIAHNHKKEAELKSKIIITPKHNVSAEELLAMVERDGLQPMDALDILKYKLETGEITQEEYDQLASDYLPDESKD